VPLPEDSSNSKLASKCVTGNEQIILGVDKFLIKRYNSTKKQIEYLVKWVGYDIHRCTWVARKDIFADTYIQLFEKQWEEQQRLKIAESKQYNQTPTYSIGDKLWVKLKGHSWWPAQIIQHEKPSHHMNDYTVIFYGDNTFAFVNDYTPKQFLIEPFIEENMGKYKKKTNELAVKEAVSMLCEEPKKLSNGKTC